MMSSVRPGSIILLHDGVGNQKETRQATEKIIYELKSQGYRFVTINELLRYNQKISILTRLPRECFQKVSTIVRYGASLAVRFKRMIFNKPLESVLAI